MSLSHRTMQSFQPNSLFYHSNKISLQLKKHICTQREKETPLCISWKGSYTIEAAVCLPLLMFLFVFILFFCRICMVQAGIQKALDDVGKVMAVASAGWQQEKEEQLMAAVLGCNQRILQYHVPMKYIQGGIAGLCYDQTKLEGNYVDLQVQYVVRLPIGFLERYSWKICQRSRSRKWVGWDPNENEGAGLYVYVTEYGSVYHAASNCSYLQPSVSSASKESAEGMRNADGGRYYPCSSCYDNGAGSETVYLTEYGALYHGRVSCSRLKRNVRRILYENVKDLKPCKKCMTGEKKDD